MLSLLIPLGDFSKKLGGGGGRELKTTESLEGTWLRGSSVLLLLQEVIIIKQNPKKRSCLKGMGMVFLFK